MAARRGDWARSGLIWLALGLLTLAAVGVRVWGLPTPEGTFGRDEARLALASRGIIEHGVPRLPGGVIYTRGLLPSYIEAGSFALFGVSDRSARFQSLLAGTLLVPLSYLLARMAVGPAGSLAAAMVAAFCAPLVLQSREAWLYSTFLPLFATVLILFHRGFSVGSGPAQLCAALAFAAALLCHELAVMALPVLLLFLVLPAGPRHPIWWKGPWTLAALAVAVMAVGMAAGLSLGLRAPTLGGSLVEVREYLYLTSSPGTLLDYLRIVSSWHLLLLPLAVLGLPLVTSWLSHGALLLYLATLCTLLMPSFLLLGRPEGRYILPALVTLAPVAAFAAARWGPRLFEALAGRRLAPRLRNTLSAALPLVLLSAPLDWAAVRRDAQVRNVPTTWVQLMADRQPGDLIISYAPTLTSHYLGRTDAWIRPRGYEKYVWAQARPLRDIHSSAILVRNARELDQLIARPNQGRTAWVLLEPALYSSPIPETLELVNVLRSSADLERLAPDGRMVLRISSLAVAASG